MNRVKQTGNAMTSNIINDLRQEDDKTFMARLQPCLEKLEACPAGETAGLQTPQSAGYTRRDYPDADLRLSGLVSAVPAAWS
jgi:hypothetical protein